MERPNRLMAALAASALGVAICLVALWPIVGEAAEKGAYPEIEYGYPEQPPRAFTNVKGEADGHYPRLLKVLFPRAGLAWHPAAYPAPRLMNNLISGETPFSILVKNALLEKCCHYSRNPVWYDELRVYSIGNKQPLRTKEDLVGKGVITLAGFSYGGLIGFLNDPANRIRIESADGHAAAFAMLAAGRADYLLDYGEPAEAEGLARNPVSNLRYDVIDKVYMYFVISKSFPDAPAILDRMEAAYSALKEEDVKHEYTKP